MESIMAYLKRRLGQIPPHLWEAIAAEAKVAKTLPRKIAYGDRDDSLVSTVEPLLNYLHAVDRGERELPDAQKVGA